MHLPSGYTELIFKMKASEITGTGWNRRKTRYFITKERSFGTWHSLPGILPSCSQELWLKKQKCAQKKTQNNIPAPHPLLHPAPRSGTAFPTRWRSPGYLGHRAGTGQRRRRSRSCLLLQGAWAEGQGACPGSPCWNKDVFTTFTTQGVEAEFPTAVCRSFLDNNYKIRIIKKPRWFGVVFNFC